MNIYRLIKYIGIIRSPRLKMCALWLAYIFKRRYLGVYIDSVLGCNYRCMMCYFSNEQIRREKHGRLTDKQINDIAYTLFNRTLKLQIGCGAEPTLDMKGCIHLIQLGKQYKVPYISITTNGVLLNEDKLNELLSAGLDEITISLHGIHRETYNKLMGATADYDAFINLLQHIKTAKNKYPRFNVRINYTMNTDNVDELADFDTLFGDIPINQLQLRPIRKIGESAYQNFDLTHVSECIDTIIKPLVERCKKRGITVIYPEKKHLERFTDTSLQDNDDSLLAAFTYCYISPHSISLSPIHWGTETYDEYAERTHTGNAIWKSIWLPAKQYAKAENKLINPLNYDIR